jgi:hypothetical protein
MTTPTPQPSELACDAALEIWNGFKVLKDYTDKDIAEIIDRHLAPLRERAERAEKADDRFEALSVAIDGFALFMDDLMKGPSTRERGEKIAIGVSHLQRLPRELREDE